MVKKLMIYMYIEQVILLNQILLFATEHTCMYNVHVHVFNVNLELLFLVDPFLLASSKNPKK